MKRIIILVLITAITFIGCKKLGVEPSINVRPDKPLLASNIEPYFGKRAVVLAFKEPTMDKGIGFFAASQLFNEMLAQGPFKFVSNAADKVWFHFDPQPSQELATAASIAKDMGFEVAIIGEVEQFIYSKNAESSLIITVDILDALTGELLHKQRIQVTGNVGYLPPLWDPSNYKTVGRDDLFLTATTTLVRRMHVRWWEGQTESEFMYENDPYYDDEPEVVTSDSEQ